MRSPMIYTISILAFLLSIILSPSTAQAEEEDLMVVLDASGSMWGQIEGTAKVDIARNVMGKVLSDFNGKAQIGVLTYGHRKKGDCSDIETIIPVGQVDR